MPHLRFHRPAVPALLAVAALLLAGSVMAQTPDPTGVDIEERVFNDCPISGLTVTNNYPTSVVIEDSMRADCLGFANLHTWSFSVNGTEPAQFMNGSHFSFCADFTISGTGTGEGGLRLAPWWSPHADGKFMANAQSGEIAAFGGRLPFYSFTANHGINYVKGMGIHMEIIYTPNDTSATNPATIQYNVVYDGNSYTSGVLSFDEGTPAEGHGSWGILNPAYAGGYAQPYAAQSAGGNVRFEWADICYSNLSGTPVERTSWGAIKNTYR